MRLKEDSRSSISNGFAEALRRYGPPPTLTLDTKGPVLESMVRVFDIWEDACNTVDRLSGSLQKKWPGAIERVNDYADGIGLTFRSEEDKMLFGGVILGAWERAYGFTGSINVTSQGNSEKFSADGRRFDDVP